MLSNRDVRHSKPGITFWRYKMNDIMYHCESFIDNFLLISYSENRKSEFGDQKHVIEFTVGVSV